MSDMFWMTKCADTDWMALWGATQSKASQFARSVNIRQYKNKRVNQDNIKFETWEGAGAFKS